MSVGTETSGVTGDDKLEGNRVVVIRALDRNARCSLVHLRVPDVQQNRREMIKCHACRETSGVAQQQHINTVVHATIWRSACE